MKTLNIRIIYVFAFLLLIAVLFKSLAAGPEERMVYTQDLRQYFLDIGYDIKVRSSGEMHDTLHLDFILFNDVWRNYFQKGTITDEWYEKGFRFVKLHGYDYLGKIWWTE